jgi:ABC-type branched-subunit amino acid transport system ATPase component
MTDQINSSQNRLEITDIHSYYGDSHVLQGCSLTIENECVAVLGRNGMGKTTLIRSIMGLTPAKSGNILWNNKELSPKNPMPLPAWASVMCLRADAYFHHCLLRNI